MNQGSNVQEEFWEPMGVSEALVAQDAAGMHGDRIGPWLAERRRTGLQVLCSARGASAFYIAFFYFQLKFIFRITFSHKLDFSQ